MEQAELLHKCGYEATAGVLADWALERAFKMESEVRYHLAELGGATTRVIYGEDFLTRRPPKINRFVLSLFFPRMFYPAFEKNSLNLDPYFLLSIARQESTLNEKAISQMNAQGLMQIQPETASKVNLGKEVDLLDPEMNIQTGAKYLTELLGRHSKPHLAIAAYNAGEDKLGNWLSRFSTEDPMLFIDLISYRETRDYVSGVLRNYYWYRRLNVAEAKPTNVISPEIAKK